MDDLGVFFRKPPYKKKKKTVFLAHFEGPAMGIFTRRKMASPLHESIGQKT